MAHFQKIKYEYYDSKNRYLGECDGFLRGLENYSNAAYCKKHVDGVFKQKIHISCVEEENEIPI